MQIANLLPNSDDWYQNSNFNEFIESHLTYISQNKMGTAQQVDDDIAAKYRGDFYGLLLARNIISDYHYIVLRLNGFTSPSDFDGQTFVLKIPIFSEIDMLKSVYKTTQKA